MTGGAWQRGSTMVGSPGSGQLSLLVSMKSYCPSLFKSTRTWVLFWVPETQTGSRSNELQGATVAALAASQGPGISVGSVVTAPGFTASGYVNWLVAGPTVMRKRPLYPAGVAPNTVP